MAGSPLKPGQIGGLKTRKPTESNSNPTMFIYGSGGAGKTALAASSALVPEMCPVLHLNLEHGSQTIEHMYPNEDIDILDIGNFKQFQDVFVELHNTGGAGYRTVIVDNLTEAQSMGVDYIHNTHEDGVDFSDFVGPTYANGGYARSTEQMRKVVRYFRGLPIYTIFIAWAKNYADSPKVDMKPAFTNTFGNEAPGLVNDLYYYTVKGGERVLQTKKTDTVEAKDRTGKLPAVIKNPTMQIIHDYWNGKLVKPTDEEVAQSNAAAGGLKKRSK